MTCPESFGLQVHSLIISDWVGDQKFRTSLETSNMQCLLVCLLPFQILHRLQTKGRLGFASDLLELYLLAFGVQLSFYTPV